MRIILSPAKKMKVDLESPYESLPMYLEKTEVLWHYLQGLSFDEAKALWKCNDRLVSENMLRLERDNLTTGLTPALFAYDGLAFSHMAPNLFTQEAFNYVSKHLRILSGFYGVLCPFDGVVSYRLEMQAKIGLNDTHSLYDYWYDLIYKGVVDEDHVFLDLASKEYSKALTNFLQPGDRLIRFTFGEIVNGKVKNKATLAKMARGEMVHYMAMHQIEDLEELKAFHELDFHYHEELSSPDEFVYIK
jgi:cytoplasmic iron level regulating protein YaaA (DUF328/UPF0246 family)